ncbi:hypothetical protein GFS24_07660 [Chitinophaga sp. SYP-B3965]|uniref:hypothetical protein n=1 Tax=Chitinophaga sp. SYP-B3965 TaxID=2663120 RepID=UPI0012999637|nr:hypothetical protein [Chitinophaga sp. SYP-B3965]MRG44985.1 hypothetical protein [Chitinophaga sp. SYP-B3965]
MNRNKIYRKEARARRIFLNMEGLKTIFTCLTVISSILLEFISEQPNPGLYYFIVTLVSMIQKIIISNQKRADWKRRRLNRIRIKLVVQFKTLPLSVERACADKLSKPKNIDGTTSPAKDLEIKKDNDESAAGHHE